MLINLTEKHANAAVTEREANAVPSAGAASNWWRSNLPAWLNYQNTLAGDQEGESIAVAQAAQTQADAQSDADCKLAYDTAGAAHDQAIDDAVEGTELTADAATEGFLYSTEKADDQQSDLDAQATAAYQTASSASYAAGIQSFDLAHPSPWADDAAAIASAQATLTSAASSALAGQQIASADAQFAESWADALAQQALDDAQATAATNLSLAQQTAQSKLNLAQTLFSNAESFQFSTQSEELPDVLSWGVGTPLTAWVRSSQGAWTPRDGVALPLALPYQAGDEAASGFGALALSGSVSSQPALSFSWLTLATFLGVPPGPLSQPGSQWPVSEGWIVPVISRDLALDSTALVGEMYRTSDLAPFPNVPVPRRLPAWPGAMYDAPNVNPGDARVLAAPTPPTPDDDADQDFVDMDSVSNPLGENAGTGFGSTPLAQLSDESQPAPDPTPTAAVQVQETEQTVAKDANAANTTVVGADQDGNDSGLNAPLNAQQKLAYWYSPLLLNARAEQAALMAAVQSSLNGPGLATRYIIPFTGLSHTYYWKNPLIFMREQLGELNEQFDAANTAMANLYNGTGSNQELEPIVGRIGAILDGIQTQLRLIQSVIWLQHDGPVMAASTKANYANGVVDYNETLQTEITQLSKGESVNMSIAA